MPKRKGDQMTPEEQSERFKEAAREHVGDGEPSLTDAERRFNDLVQKVLPQATKRPRPRG
ncbi:MAG: hypothetical protein JWM94_2828 [Sphingomonas bacterium]|nr:hypothetical protein [Sphingomonas bacterium]